MKQSARYFIHGQNTCSVERYHRERLKLTPKLLEFWATWEPRCALNQLYHNYGYAETHRMVLAKLATMLPQWLLDIVPGNRYMAAMDRERAYHSRRKSDPAYNRRKQQLAREFGKRRAAHDRTSQNLGHDYEHTPPLFAEGEKKTRKPRRSKEQIEREAAEKDAEKQRLRALFDKGDTTFTTLGVIDVNLQPKGKKKKKKKKGEKGKKREKGEAKVKGGEQSTAAGKENSDPPRPDPPRKRQKRDLVQPAKTARMEVESTPLRAEGSGTSNDRRSTTVTVARAIRFR
jgi:hypothetical protein